MMKKLLIFLCAIFLLFGMSGVAGAAPSYLWGSGSENWTDASKTGSDGLLCWAAASANILAWGGWDGGPTLASAQDIFEEFKKPGHWTNAVGSPMYGTEWWLTGHDVSTYDPGDGSHEDLPDAGGGFYPTVNWQDWSGATTDDVYGFVPYSNASGAMDSIKGYVDSGIPNVIQVAGTYGHSLTIWGYDWAGGTVDGTVYVTDSDNAVGLDSYSVFKSSDTWWIDDYFGSADFEIREVHRLWTNVGGEIEPYLDEEPPDGVPEPATMLLLGTGLLGLALTGRRIRRS